MDLLLISKSLQLGRHRRSSGYTASLPAISAPKRAKMAQELTIAQPCDMHLHLRDDAVLKSVASLSAAWAGRAIIMPNLQPPVTTAAMAVAYRERILAALGPDTTFEPLMTLYLTDTTSPDDIAAAKATGVIKSCKMYPAGATTNSANGVTDLMKLIPTFAAMEVRAKLPVKCRSPGAAVGCELPAPAPWLCPCRSYAAAGAHLKDANAFETAAGARDRAVHPRRGGRGGR